MASQSLGDCWDHPDKHRYERCELGGSCRRIPVAAVPIALFFLDYVQAGEAGAPVLAKEKNKRRAAVKVVLAGIADGTFPSSGDPRLAA
ncbi:hypothetical protein ACHAO9_012543 [Fusarium lateritium]